MTRRWMGFVLGVVTAATAGCVGGTGDGEDALSDAEMLLQAGQQALSENDFEMARTSFQDLSLEPGYECKAEYGLMLSRIQEGADRIDQLVDAAALFAGGAPGADLIPQQVGLSNLNSVLASVLEPFETIFSQVRTHGLVVIEDGCRLMVPDGFPIELGNPDSLLYFRVGFGYEFDEPVARAVVAAVDSVQALINFLLSHELVFDDLEAPLDVFTEALGDLNTVETVDGEDVTVTYITLLRSVGAFLDLNPVLLAFQRGADSRMAEVDDNLEEAFQLTYTRDNSGESGIIPALQSRSLNDENPRDNVLGLIDDGNGIAGTGDTLVLGIRELSLAGSVALPDIAGGVELTLNSAFGDFDEVVRLYHEMVLVLGDQMKAVDEPATEWRRLGLEEVNGIIDSINLLANNIEPLPEALEFDARAYFTDPISVRGMMPYWYDDDGVPTLDDDGDLASPDVFMIEGESAVTAYSLAVTVGDAPHFPDAFEFGSVGSSQKDIENNRIAADGVSAADLGLETPFPYIAWQSPSFGGMLYIDPRALPVAPQTLGPADENGEYFAEATQYTVNKALNEYIYYFANDQSLGLAP